MVSFRQYVETRGIEIPKGNIPGEWLFESRKATYSNIIGLAIDDSKTEFGRFKEIWEKYDEKN